MKEKQSKKSGDVLKLKEIYSHRQLQHYQG